MNGYIKLNRDVLLCDWMSDPAVVSVYVQCRMRANVVSRVWRGITIPAGSFVTSRLTLAEYCGLTEKQIRRALDILEADGVIERKRAGSGLLVSLREREDYDADGITQGRTQGRTRGRTQGRPSAPKTATTREGENSSTIVEHESGEHAHTETNLFGEKNDPNALLMMRQTPAADWVAFSQLPEVVKLIAEGVDVEYYHSALLRWSDTRGPKAPKKFFRTAQGWVSTVINGIERDRGKGQLKLVGHVEGKKKAQLGYFAIAQGQ